MNNKELLNEQLIKAILDKNYKKVYYILALKADVNARACEGIGCSALSVAKKIGATDIANLLEQRGGIEINPSSEEADELGKKIFDFGADDKEEIKRLFFMGANLEVTNILGDTLFVDAVRNSKYTVTNLLIELGADIHAKTREGRNALFYAVRYFNEDLFFDLLERGVSPHVVDKEGYNLLHEAIDCPIGGERLKTLINKGVNLEQGLKRDGTTPLVLACLWENSYSALELIKAGCDVNVRNTDNNKIPLNYVVYSSRMKIEVLEAMLERGADIDYEGYMGCSVLSHALHSGDKLESVNVWKKIALLIEYGANIKDSVQKLIDEKSKYYGKEEMIKEAFVKREERKIKEEQQRQIRIEQMQKKVGEMKRKEDAKVLKEVSEKKIKNSWWNKFFKIER
ncbi:MAG: ankyrin repeat domain-containing protein [Alphaproteobacteria bacterium]|nr:ankyrin repeat domain-containing protein [Alphaproteobacteria bacterium]